MKIPVRTIELKDLDPEYGSYYLKVVRSVKEKWTRRFQEWAKEGKDDPQVASSANLAMLDLVQEWNLDDDNGNVLPLVKDTADHEECKPADGRHHPDCAKLAVMGEIPIEVIIHLAETVAGGGKAAIPEKTQDFSKES